MKPASFGLAALRGMLAERAPLERLAFLGLIGFVAASPFSISVSQFFAFSGIAVWLFMFGRVSGLVARARLPLWQPFTLFAVLTLASAFHADEPLRSLVSAHKLFQILVFYLAVNEIRDEREALWALEVLFAVAALVSAYTLMTALREPIGLANRMSGFFSIYMTLGGYLMVVGSLVLAFLLLPGGNREAWLYAAGGLMVAALLTTFSRNAWIGIAVALLVVAFAGRSIRAAVIVAAAIALAVLLAPQTIRDRIRSMTDPRDPTAVERVLMWKSGLRMVRERPWLGFGPGGIKRNYHRYASPEARKQYTGHLHNNLLQIAAERGLPALAAWLWIWVAFFTAVFRRLFSIREGPFTPRFLAVGGMAAAAGLLSAGMFEWNFGDSEVAMITFFALALPFVGNRRESEI